MAKNSGEVKFLHLDAISYNKDGGLALGASNLNSRLWTGSLSCFATAEDAPHAPLASVLVEAGITDLKWLQGSNRLMTCTDGGAVYLWKFSQDRNALLRLSQRIEHDDIVSRMSVNCDASKFVSASYDRSITVWDCEDFTPTSCFTAHHDIVWDVAFHSTHPHIFLSCSQDGQILLWDLRKMKPASKIDCKHLPSFPTCVAWQPNSKEKFSVGTETGQIVMQDSRAVGNTASVSAHSRLVYRIAFSPCQSDWLASASQDCNVAVSTFKGTDGTVIYRDWSHNDFVQGLAWNPVNNILTTCSWDNCIQSHKVLTEAGVGSDAMETETHN